MLTFLAGKTSTAVGLRNSCRKIFKPKTDLPDFCNSARMNIRPAPFIMGGAGSDMTLKKFGLESAPGINIYQSSQTGYEKDI
jgi:hypothetical protein